MLTTRMQVQYIADRLAGFPVDANVRFFAQPWQACWNAIASAAVGCEQDALYTITSGLPNQKEVLQAILGTRPGFVPTIKSLEDMGPDLPPIEWVWKDHIPRGLLSILGASQGSGKSFVGLDLAYRIIHNIGFPDGAPIVRPGANIIYVDAEAVPQIREQERINYPNVCAGWLTKVIFLAKSHKQPAIPGMNKTVGVIFHKTGKNNAEVASRAGFQPIFSLSMGNLRH